MFAFPPQNLKSFRASRRALVVGPILVQKLRMIALDEKNLSSRCVVSNNAFRSARTWWHMFGAPVGWFVLNVDFTKNRLVSTFVTFAFNESSVCMAFERGISHSNTYDSHPNVFGKSASHTLACWRDEDCLALILNWKSDGISRARSIVSFCWTLFLRFSTLYLHPSYRQSSSWRLKQPWLRTKKDL